MTSRVKLFSNCLSRKNKCRTYSSQQLCLRFLTLLRSLVVTPSSSRQGSLCTNASIWYLALMNSDLVGLHRRGRWLPKAQASKVNKNTRGQNMWNCNSCNKPYYTGKCVLASWLQVHMAPHRGIWSPTRGKVILIWLHFSLSPPHSHQIERSGAFLCEVQTQKVL